MIPARALRRDARSESSCRDAARLHGGATPCSTTVSRRIQRAANPARVNVQDVRVNHRRRHIAMPEKLLHCSNVVPSLQQMRGKRMPERVTTHTFANARLFRRRSHGPLHHRLM